MRRSSHNLPWMICLLGLASGCAMPAYISDGGSPVPEMDLRIGVPGELIDRPSRLRADASGLLPAAELHRLPSQAERNAGQYTALAAKECQCQAAAKSSLANLLELEQGVGNCKKHACLHRKSSCSEALKDDLLALRAVDERNRSAGQALELYYRLAEAEAGLDILGESQERVDHVLANVAELKKQGLQADVDVEALRRRKLEMFDQQAEAELAREQSHSGLKALLGMSPDDSQRIWPLADLQGAAEPGDVQTAINVGLSTRADLILLRCLSESLSMQILPGAQAALQQRDPSLGASSVDPRKLHALLAGTRTDRDLPIRQAQVYELVADGERMAAEEIRSAWATVATRLKQAALAQETLNGRRRRLEDLQRKREVGTATPFEVAAERLEITKAEGDLMRRVVAWRIAQVKLKQSQGLLAAECGYEHSPNCGTCGGACVRGRCRSCGPLAASHSHQQAGTAVAKARPANQSAGPRIVRLGEPTPANEQLATPPAVRRIK